MSDYQSSKRGVRIDLLVQKAAIHWYDHVFHIPNHLASKLRIGDSIRSLSSPNFIKFHIEVLYKATRDKVNQTDQFSFCLP
jgi:hypothetical protein